MDTGQRPAAKRRLGRPRRRDDRMEEEWSRSKPGSWGLEAASGWLGEALSAPPSPTGCSRSVWAGVAPSVPKPSVGPWHPEPGSLATGWTSTTASWAWLCGGGADLPGKGPAGDLGEESRLGDLPLGAEAAVEGLSGRGLGMSSVRCRREPLASLAWGPLGVGAGALDELVLTVGATAARGVVAPLEEAAAAGGASALLLGVGVGVSVSLPEPPRELDSALLQGLSRPSPGSPRFRLSPMDTERDILAMELVVGLM